MLSSTTDAIDVVLDQKCMDSQGEYKTDLVKHVCIERADWIVNNVMSWSVPACDFQTINYQI